MLDVFKGLIKSFIDIFKYPIYFILGIIGLLFVLICINIIILLIKGKRFRKGKRNIVRHKSIFRKLFIEAPKRIAEDIIERDPEFFRHQGCVIFTGRQGAGKSIAMIEYAMRMQKEYPLAKCISNIAYKYQDDELRHWRQLINYKNGKRGVIVIMDELQNWFSSNQSRNFPPEMLSVITQNRKNRRIILGTSQSFHLLAKSIRTQATEVRECMTIFGAITFVRRREPILDADGDVVEWKNRGIYFFVHNQKLRESYDTWQVTESLAKSGFQDRDYLSDDSKKVIVKMG